MEATLLHHLFIHKPLEDDSAALKQAPLLPQDQDTEDEGHQRKRPPAPLSGDPRRILIRTGDLFVFYCIQSIPSAVAALSYLGSYCDT